MGAVWGAGGALPAARPSAERFQSAILICTPLRAHGAQSERGSAPPAQIGGEDGDLAVTGFGGKTG